MIVTVTGDEPRVLTLEDGMALPSGPFQQRHRSLQMGARSWVEEQTYQKLGYVEQLYTFADRGRTRGGEEMRVVSISYLGLTHESGATGSAGWHSWYRYFPWEDWRAGPPRLVASAIIPRLTAWARTGADAQRRARAERIAVTFATSGRDWNEDFVLQRYELLWEAGLVPEAGPDVGDPLPGVAMTHDHRRILATGIARLRAKMKYRPVMFELMPESFTLLRLQRVVEAVAGRRLHKQNFRRLIEQQGLVEETGEVSTETGGRPAKLFRYRRDVLVERASVGTKLPLYRSD
ncbi:MAG TPA: hypothetical protein VL993_19590 [Stellaceae bacterium]|nr:hypothetical protein [Stellaceae bacterium]